MKTRSLFTGALVGGMLTASLVAIMYLADQLAGLPFVPFDLFDWMTRVLPGPVITFAIDLMIDTMLALGLDVADVAKTAEQLMAVLQFLVIGVGAGALFFVVTAARRARAELIAGVVM
ncbi:MAG: molybdopterin-dependent oxidoreductase, partial [Ardenticatenaceae bacterium]